jgi:hypothetical protein
MAKSKSIRGQFARDAQADAAAAAGHQRHFSRSPLARAPLEEGQVFSLGHAANEQPSSSR